MLDKINANLKTEPDEVQHQFGKLMLATGAAFIAAKLVEYAYNSALERSKITSTPEIPV